MSTTRPRIAILARFAESTSATRYAAIVTARRLAELVWAAGGEPLTMIPVAGADLAEAFLYTLEGALLVSRGLPKAQGPREAAEVLADAAYPTDPGIRRYVRREPLGVTNVEGVAHPHEERPGEHGDLLIGGMEMRFDGVAVGQLEPDRVGA